MSDSKIYDLVVIGAGPAGLTSALFAKRQGLDVIVLDSPENPSNLELAHYIENHPGTRKIRGSTLLKRMKKQVAGADIEIRDEKTMGVTKDKNFIILTEKRNYQSHAVVISTGLVSRKANITGEELLLGKGVSYCVLCDGPLFVDKTVVVIGGGDSAVTGAIQLKEMGAKKVYIIHRRNEFRAEKANLKKLEHIGIEKIMSSVIEEIKGKNSVHSIKLKNLETGKEGELAVDGVFVEIGYVPTAELAKKLNVHLDGEGFVKVNEKMETNILGVFAAGDITNPAYKILVNAYYQGSVAALSAAQFVSIIKGSKFTARVHW